MNFFNKYKDLFGVPQNTPIPKSKLTVNNQLFIDKPFVPTYRETLSINSKLRDLRKDYNQLQHQIQSISAAMTKSPKRAVSRKSRELQQNIQKSKLNNSIKQIISPSAVPETSNSPFLKHNKKNHSQGNLKNYNKIELMSSYDYQNPHNQRNNQNRYNQINYSNLQNRPELVAMSESQQVKDPFTKRKLTWLKDQQVNLLKHTEMNYIFNHKIEQQNNKMKSINFPKLENFVFGVSNVDNSGNNVNSPTLAVVKNQSFKPTNRTRIIQNSIGNTDKSQLAIKKRESNKNQLDRNAALKRREQAKRNIGSRKQKLAVLYRTSW